VCLYKDCKEESIRNSSYCNKKQFNNSIVVENYLIATTVWQLHLFIEYNKFIKKQ